MQLLKNLEEFSHRIEIALCSDSETHTQNERSMEMSNIRLQYRTTLSAVVTAITTRQITPEILPVSSLRKSLNIKNNLFENNILTSYSLIRIHHNIYCLNKSLMFLVVFLSSLAKICRLYKPFVIPRTIAEKQWKIKYFLNDVRLINYNHQLQTTPIGPGLKKTVLLFSKLNTYKNQI